MVKRILSVLTIWGLIVGCCMAFSEEPQPAAPSAPAVAPPAPPPATTAPPRQSAAPTTFTEPSAGEQMQALARHAGKGMICYTANRGALAQAGKEVTALALKTAPAPRK